MKMIKLFQLFGFIFLLIATTSFKLDPVNKVHFPYREIGLTEQQAAAHLLSRFTFGARPGDVDKVVHIGLEKWFRQQLSGKLADTKSDEHLREMNLLQLTNQQVVEQFPNEQKLKQMAIEDGFIAKDSIAKLSQKELRQKLKEYRSKKGYHEERELFNQFINQKLIRAAFSDNQLHEVLTDFWFNHFNVSMTKNQCARFIPSYERDVIRPNVLQKFETILLATAKSPAMLLYLDNASSVGENAQFEEIKAQRQARRKVARKTKQKITDDKPKRKRSEGLNENYAREVMELHTLGVDGGYTQADVTEAARVLTGWTVYPFGANGQGANLKAMLEKMGEHRLAKSGFVHEGDFLFAINRHDGSPKTVLGKTFSTGDYEEGVQLLKLLAHHPATAKFISRKLAVRFVGDNPTPALVDKMANEFMSTGGDISKVLWAMVSAKEFWDAESLRSKIKSPFEYGISAIRSLNADIKRPEALNQWITRMGQKLYSYQAPTGFPDKAQYWINTGSLLARMNFGLAVASKKIQGIEFDLAELNNRHEPESAEAALPIYASLLLPERNLETTLQRLMPLVTQQHIQKNIENASDKKDTTKTKDSGLMQGSAISFSNKINQRKSFGDNQMLAQIVGIIIGSPEFQRR
jgi:uncharacterized protein (DUF1800 family)